MKKTSEAKKRYNDKTYSRYTLLFRKDSDQAYIDYMECMRVKGLTPTEAIKRLIKKVL